MGNSFVLEALLSQASDRHDLINLQDCQGQTALMNAAFNGHQNALLLLVHFHADMNLALFISEVYRSNQRLRDIFDLSDIYDFQH